MPAQYLWTGSGAFETAANWTNLVAPHDHTVPGASDDAVFNPDIGSNASCTLGTDLTVERVTMDADYTGTLTIASGSTLTVDDSFQQYGTLTLESNGSGGTGITADSFYINDQINMFAGGSAFLYGGDFFFMGDILVSGGGMSAALTITTTGFDDGGDIVVGSTLGAYGSLTIVGPYVQQPGSTTTIWGNGLVTYHGGGGNAIQTISGTIDMTGDIATNTQLKVDGGELNTFDNGAAIAGDVGVEDGGVINVGTSNSASTLTHLSGDLTIADGVVNLFGGSSLDVPTASSSSFIVQGELNMYGAFITMDPSRTTLDVDGGVLYTEGRVFSSTQVGDTITGNVINDGTIDFGGNLHTLNIMVYGGVAGGDYTQGASSNLAMRLSSGPSNDLLSVADDAILNGDLTLTGGSLPNTTTWTIIGATGGRTGNFNSFYWPDGDPDWRGLPGSFGYDVAN